MVRAVAEKGFARVTVKDVLAGAGVSRETFYEQFANKDDCFWAAFDGASATVQHAITGSWHQSTAEAVTPHERLDRAVTAYLEALAAEPVVARVFMIDVLGAGPEAIVRRYQGLEAFTALVAGLIEARTPDEHRRAEAFVGATSAMVSTRLALGRADELPGLREHLLDLAKTLWP